MIKNIYVNDDDDSEFVGDVFVELQQHKIRNFNAFRKKKNHDPHLYIETVYDLSKQPIPDRDDVRSGIMIPDETFFIRVPKEELDKGLISTVILVKLFEHYIDSKILKKLLPNEENLRDMINTALRTSKMRWIYT